MSTEALAAAAPLSLNTSNGRSTSPSASANKTGVAGRVASLNAAAGAGNASNAAPSSVAMGKSGSANNASSASSIGASKQGMTSGAPPDITSPHELTAWVEDVLSRLETSFDAMSGQVLDRLETISKRIDTVEQSISDLVQGNVSLEAPEQQSNTSSIST